jgi:hypothetical protein
MMTSLGRVDGRVPFEFFLEIVEDLSLENAALAQGRFVREPAAGHRVPTSRTYLLISMSANSNSLDRPLKLLLVGGDGGSPSSQALSRARQLREQCIAKIWPAAMVPARLVVAVGLTSSSRKYIFALLPNKPPLFRSRRRKACPGNGFLGSGHLERPWPPPDHKSPSSAPRKIKVFHCRFPAKIFHVYYQRHGPRMRRTSGWGRATGAG